VDAVRRPLTVSAVILSVVALAACGSAKQSAPTTPAQASPQPSASATPMSVATAGGGASATPASGSIDVIWSIDGSPNKLSFATRLATDIALAQAEKTVSAMAR